MTITSNYIKQLLNNIKNTKLLKIKKILFFYTHRYPFILSSNNTPTYIILQLKYFRSHLYHTYIQYNSYFLTLFLIYIYKYTVNISKIQYKMDKKKKYARKYVEKKQQTDDDDPKQKNYVNCQQKQKVLYQSKNNIQEKSKDKIQNKQRVQQLKYKQNIYNQLRSALQASNVPQSLKFQPFAQNEFNQKTAPLKLKQYQKMDKENQMMLVKEMISEADENSLKKYLIQVLGEVDKIFIKYQTTKPLIFIEYINGNHQQILQLRDLVKANDSLKKNKQLIQRIMSALYRKVQLKYYRIGYFGIRAAYQKRINFKDRNFNNKPMTHNINEYMFYYATKGDKINFVLFDSALNSVEFNTDEIKRWLEQDQQNYRICKQFKKAAIKKEHAQQMATENFGQQQVDSDQQSRNKRIAQQKSPSIVQLRARIQKITKKNIDDMQEDIDAKNEINFEFMVRKFKIKQAEKFNPFYQKITKKLPSLFFWRIMNDYQRRNFEDATDTHFLRKLSINFYEDRNQIQILYRKKVQNNPSVFNKVQITAFKQKMSKFLNYSKYKESENAQQIIIGYLKQLQTKYKSIFKYNYVGPIYISLKDGFQLQKIDFETFEHIYKVYAQDVFAGCIHLYCHQFGTCQMRKQLLIFKINEQQDRQLFQNTLKALINNFKINNNVDIKYTHELEDCRKKIPQAKLFLHFWAGKSQTNSFYLSFNGIRQFEQSRYKQQWLRQFIKCFQTKRLYELGAQNKLRGLNFEVAKNKKGINCYSKSTSFNRRGKIVPKNDNVQIDQLQLSEILLQYDKRKLFQINFTMPTGIKKFRQPDTKFASRNQNQWENQIKDILMKENMHEDKIAIRVWGRQHYNKYQKNLSVFQRNLKVQWHAQIKTFDFGSLKKFQQKYDGKKGILGNQKTHIRFEFQQVAAITTQKVFQALADQFQGKVDYIKAESPGVTIQHFSRTFKKLTRVYIKIRSKNRDQLIAPTLRIVQLFTPKTIPLPQAKFRFLDKFNEGNQILQDIQFQYNYKIYFATQRKSFSLKVYCETAQLDKIIQTVNKRMQKFNLFEQQICYRGKDLNTVKQIIQLKIEQIEQNKYNKRFLKYEIIFKFRKIRISGDLLSCDEVKNQIMKMVDKEKSQCDICCDLLQRPYKLYNCGQQFCWVCLSSYIRQTIINSNKQLLKCPGCAKQINIFDVQKIMNKDQFNKLCDIQISRYIERNPAYQGCFSPNCQNIFLIEEVKKNNCFQCDLCGKWYCYKCKQPHQYYTCSDWKFKLDDPKALKALGIKRCPQCKQGIQKNKECQHVQCIKCHVHICWNCLAYFETFKECNDHLTQKCGGNFFTR